MSYKILKKIIYYQPANKPSADLILICRGGSNDFFYWNKQKLARNFQAFSKAGFHVAAFDYPANDQYGGLSDLDFIKKIPNDLKKVGLKIKFIGIFGASRGGLMVYRLLKDVSWVKVAVIKSAPSDMEKLLEQRPDLKKYLAGKFNVKSKKSLISRSPIKWTSELHDRPILILHGKKDERVPFEQSKKIYQQLKKYHKKPTKLVAFPNGDHALKGFPVLQLSIDWFKKYL